jgi:hypothetical protein
MDTSFIDAGAALSLPIFLAVESRQIPLICISLNMRSLSLLDVAVSICGARQQWLIILKTITCQTIDVWHHSHSSMRWMMMRSIRVTQIIANRKHSERVSDLTFGAVGMNGSRTSCDEEVKSDDNFLMWEESKYVLSIDISGCQGITDLGLAAVDLRCRQLQTINLSGCQGIKDVGLAALGLRCCQLQTINLSGCKGITDLGLAAVGRGCSQLQTINLSGCQGITDLGLAALGRGCSHLQTIDLSNSKGITAIGLSALCDGCGHLQTIILADCLGITSTVLSSLRLRCSICFTEER